MKLNLPVVVAAAFLLAACSTAGNDGAGSGSGGDSASGSSASGGPAGVTGAAPGSQLDLEINVGDRVFFDFDRSTLRPAGRTTVERWAAWMQTYPANKVVIEGHADERGTREYNLALGERRANASREYLVSLGIDPNRIKTVSFGKERPAIPGSNDNAYAQNRRSVVLINTN